MTLASLDVDEVEAERKVIAEEAREIESPQARLDQMHELTSYVKHPYRNPVLGWPKTWCGSASTTWSPSTRLTTGPTVRCWCWPAMSSPPRLWRRSRPISDR